MPRNKDGVPVTPGMLDRIRERLYAEKSESKNYLLTLPLFF
jgi:hypothetical protein